MQVADCLLESGINFVSLLRSGAGYKIFIPFRGSLHIAWPLHFAQLMGVISSVEIPASPGTPFLNLVAVLCLLHHESLMLHCLLGLCMLHSSSG